MAKCIGATFKNELTFHVPLSGESFATFSQEYLARAVGYVIIIVDKFFLVYALLDIVRCYLHCFKALL